VESGELQPEGAPIRDSIATNFSHVTKADDSKTAEAASEMGAFASGNPAEKGCVNLHSNVNVPRDRTDSPQDVLLVTDPSQIPIDPSTHLPD